MKKSESEKPRGGRGKRLDIQAMRALAVLAVVIYHLWPNRLSGGFTGVDIFFVISGYLMTLTILKHIQQEKILVVNSRKKVKAIFKFITSFYARRIRRLAPAALVTLGAILAVTLAFTPLYVQSQTAEQVFKSAIFVENWHLAGRAVDYLGQAEGATAVQHFWSLSVEEQFYLIWPALMLVGATLGTTLTILWRKRKINGGIAVPILVTAGCFIYGYWLTKTNPAAAYFVTPARLWELSFGGIIAMLPAVESRKFKLLLPWLGVAMCLYAIFLFDGSGFPGWHALIPVIGAGLIIYGGSDSKFSFQNLTRFKPIQIIGDISYSLYLWHWPLIVLTPIIMHAELSTNGKWIILIASCAMAWLSYHLVEMPFQKGWRALKFWRRDKDEVAV